MDSNEVFSPPPRRGRCALQIMSRYLKQGAAGEVRTWLQEWFDLPGRAESTVAYICLIGAATPPRRRGKTLGLNSFTCSIAHQSRHHQRVHFYQSLDHMESASRVPHPPSLLRSPDHL